MATESFYRVVLDSNFLLLPFQFGVDIFAELDRILDVRYEVCVAKVVIEELKSIKSKYAKGALSIAKKLKVLDLRGERADDVLFELASKNTIICTTDKVLMDRIRKKGVPVIYLRQRKYLAMNGYLK